MFSDLQFQLPPPKPPKKTITPLNSRYLLFPQIDFFEEKFTLGELMQLKH